jgi:hypothetical protein
MQLRDEPNMPPGAITLGQLTWLRAYGAMTANGKQPSAANQAKLDALDAWVQQAIALVPPPPPPAPPAPPPGMMPGAPPGAPPPMNAPPAPQGAMAA